MTLPLKLMRTHVKFAGTRAKRMNRHYTPRRVSCQCLTPPRPNKLHIQGVLPLIYRNYTGVVSETHRAGGMLIH